MNQYPVYCKIRIKSIFDMIYFFSLNIQKNIQYLLFNQSLLFLFQCGDMHSFNEESRVYKCDDDDSDQMCVLRREIERYLKDFNYMDMRNKLLDKSVYRMKKDQLFNRMQIEKNEKDYQDCLCRVSTYIKV